MDAGSRPLTVVIIDDEAPLRTLVQIALDRSGVATVVAESDGRPETVADACDTEPDVVLLDQNLNGVRGTALIGEITRRAPRAMIAMLTALDPGSEEAAALSAGAFVFYEKTIIASGLAACLVEDHHLFRSALDGREVHAPSAMSRRRLLSTEPSPDQL
jgi:DNA-binding response OmpR family regulator